MQYLADPTPIQASAPYDDADLRAKLKMLADNETVDDKFAADLKAVVDAIRIPDLTPYAKKSDLIKSGSTLPIDDKDGTIFFLKNHTVLPNGVYFWDGLWVQV